MLRLEKLSMLPSLGIIIISQRICMNMAGEVLSISAVLHTVKASTKPSLDMNTI